MASFHVSAYFTVHRPYFHMFPLDINISFRPVLMVADPTKPYVLQTDASNFGLGAVLSQTGDDGLEHPVAYASVIKLQPREIKYSTIEKECVAIVWSLKLFHMYLYGQAFSIETDHQPLSWLQK